MLGSETTTTIKYEEQDEDKTLILDGPERLKYFNLASTPVKQPLSRQPNSLWQRIRRLLH